MECKEALLLLSPLLDEELDKTQREELSVHLRDCQACRDEFEAMKKLKNLLKGLQIPEPSMDLPDIILARIKTVRSKEHFYKDRLFTGVAAAVLLLSILAGTYLGSIIIYPKEQTASNQIDEYFALNSFTSSPSGSVTDSYSKLTEGR
jgi:predicted anti-sigma-YlaC factor YlaD